MDFSDLALGNGERMPARSSTLPASHRTEKRLRTAPATQVLASKELMANERAAGLASSLRSRDARGRVEKARFDSQPRSCSPARSEIYQDAGGNIDLEDSSAAHLRAIVEEAVTTMLPRIAAMFETSASKLLRELKPDRSTASSRASYQSHSCATLQSNVKSLAARTSVRPDMRHDNEGSASGSNSFFSVFSGAKVSPSTGPSLARRISRFDFLNVTARSSRSSTASKLSNINMDKLEKAHDDILFKLMPSNGSHPIHEEQEEEDGNGSDEPAMPSEHSHIGFPAAPDEDPIFASTSPTAADKVKQGTKRSKESFWRRFEYSSNGESDTHENSEDFYQSGHIAETAERMGSIKSAASMQGMEAHRHAELLKMAWKRQGAKKQHVFLMWLQFAGIVPWSAIQTQGLINVFSSYWTHVNRAVVVILLGFIIAFYSQLMVGLHGDGELAQTCDFSLCMQHLAFPNLALTCGCFLRLVSLGFLNELGTGTADAILNRYLSGLRVLDLWALHSRHHMVRVLLGWFLVIILSVWWSFDWKLDSLVAVSHIAMLSYTTNVFLAFAFSMLHLCRGLFLGIDGFCYRLVEGQDLAHAVDNWNMFQAVLRRVSVTIAHTYIVLLTSALAATFLPIVFVDINLVTMLPGACALLVILWVTICIGHVTTKCDRVPSFINSLDFGTAIDVDRQYVVNYITNSGAGFYMFEIRVTGEMVAKCSYIFFILSVAFTTHLLQAKKGSS